MRQSLSEGYIVEWMASQVLDNNLAAYPDFEPGKRLPKDKA